MTALALRLVRVVYAEVVGSRVRVACMEEVKCRCPPLPAGGGGGGARGVQVGPPLDAGCGGPVRVLGGDQVHNFPAACVVGPLVVARGGRLARVGGGECMRAFSAVAAQYVQARDASGVRCP